MTSLKEKVIKGSVLVIILSLLGSIFAYMIRVLYARTLSVEGYGLFYAVFGLFSIISVHTDLGFGEAISYFVPKYFKSKKYKQLWNTFVYGQIIQVFVSLLIASILMILSPFLSERYFKVVGSETLIYTFSIFLIINSLLNSFLQIFVGLQKPKYYSSINVLRTILVLSFSLIFFMFNFNTPIYYALSWVFGYFLTTVFFLYLLWSKHPLLTKNNLSWDKDIFNKMSRYALSAFATTFIYSLLSSSDIFFLTLFRGVREVGVYNVILPLASISVIFLSPLNLILFPLISSLMEGEKEKISYLVNKIYQYAPFIGVYFALFIILFPSSIVGLTFGHKWIGLIETSLSFLALGYVAIIFSNILGIIILGMGKVGQRLKILIVMATLTICLDVVLILKYGVIGAVVTNSIIALLICLIFTKLIRSIVFFKIPFWFYIKLLFISILTFFTIRFIGFAPKNWPELILSGFIYTAIFVFLGFVLKIYDKKLVELVLPQQKL